MLILLGMEQEIIFMKQAILNKQLNHLPNQGYGIENT